MGGVGEGESEWEGGKVSGRERERVCGRKRERERRRFERVSSLKRRWERGVLRALVLLKEG